MVFGGTLWMTFKRHSTPASKFLIVPEATLGSLEREASEFTPAKGLQKQVEQLVAISRIRSDGGRDRF